MPEYKGYHIRDGKEGETDKYIINEPFYNKIVTQPDDVVMDVGAHIGTFVRRVFHKVDQIFAYEPDPDNFRLLSLNTEEIENVTLINRAVIGTMERNTDLWLGNPSIHSTVRYRGRGSITVPACNFHEQIAFVRPSLLKMDIEGGEYDLLRDLTKLPLHVKRIALEIHLNRPEWRDELAPHLIQSLEEQGFGWITAPRITAGNWTTNVIGERE